MKKIVTENLTRSVISEKHPLANQIAGTILKGFDKHYDLFLKVTRKSKSRFEQCDWNGTKIASQKRISFYTKRVQEATTEVRSSFDLESFDRSLWHDVKLVYITLLYEHKQPELAESFYNSIFTSLFHRHYYNNHFLFERPGVSTEYLDGGTATYYSFYPATYGLAVCVKSILQLYQFEVPYKDLQRDSERIVAVIKSHFGNKFYLSPNFQIHTLSSLFYRNKAAYIIGQANNGPRIIPFVIALMNNESGGVYVDALLIDKDDIANIFSFARAYFMVDTKTPAAVVRFLQRMLPTKTAADLYLSIGLQKQGKTEFYRNFLHHLRHSNDQFIVAPGTKGLVMSVFTLPSYPFVFKVINDRFAPPKKVTRSIVKEKYHLVKMHDRVGRMADTLEFSHAAFPKNRFSQELLDELAEKIPNSMEFENDMIIIRHLYIERRLTPLNIYLETENHRKSAAVMIEYGRAIKDLAAANIFPGDLLLKNFGVTRHGRVIFYDYDEIELMADCRFRKIPPPRYPEDELLLEPWYSIAEHDVFPEEFPAFILNNNEIKPIFMEQHAELFTTEFWKDAQKSIEKGVYQNIFPYSRRKRFKALFAKGV